MDTNQHINDEQMRHEVAHMTEGALRRFVLRHRRNAQALKVELLLDQLGIVGQPACLLQDAGARESTQASDHTVKNGGLVGGKAVIVELLRELIGSAVDAAKPVTITCSLVIQSQGEAKGTPDGVEHLGVNA